jgi:hypothetical protein
MPQTSPVTLDMSTAQPISAQAAPVTLDMATATPISGAPQQPPAHGALASAALKAIGTGADVAEGFAKGAGDTVSGVSHLINKIPGVGETLAPSQGTAALDQMDKSTDTAQKVGKVGESIAEFALGDEELSGLAKGMKFVKAARESELAAKTLNLATAHPWLAKMIVEGGKGAVVGGAQGAIKGAQENDALGGAVAGATGGAIGGAAGSGVTSLASKATPVESLTRAIRPTGKLAQNFADKAELALPRLAAEHANSPITNLDELSDAAHEAAKNLWNNEVIPQIQKHADEIISGSPVAAAIRKGVSAGDADLFPEAVDSAEAFAKKFDGNMSLQQASDRMQSLNRKLSTLYKLDPAARYAATANSTALEAMEDGANELRQQINSKLESLGEDDPAGLRKTYGALKTVEQAAEKRAAVVGRTAPLNLAQQLATVGGALHAVAHLAAGDVPGAVAGVAPIVAAKATKVLNSPEHLIGSALEEGEGAMSRLANKAGKKAANVGSQVGQVIAHMENEGEQ